MKKIFNIKASMMLQGLIISILVFSGCVSVGLQKAAPDIKTYAIELNAPHQPASSIKPVSLRVSTFSAVPFFSDRYLAYRSGETAYEQDFYNQLIAAPVGMIQDEISVWLKDSPLVAAIVTPDVASESDYVIDGRLIELSGDYRIESEPKAVLKLQLTVSADQAVLCQKIYTAEVPMKRISPVALAEGWNQGLSQIMVGFETDLAAALAGAGNK